MSNDMDRTSALRHAEIETLLADVVHAGANARHLRLVLVEWLPAGELAHGVIRGPRGYRHPFNDPDEESFRKMFAVRGVCASHDKLMRPRGQRAYSFLIDGESKAPFEPWKGQEPRSRRGVDVVLGLYERAGALVRDLECVRALKDVRGVWPWLVALLELTRPDERFTWDEWARAICPPSTFAWDANAACAVDPDVAPEIPVCHHIHDTIHASQVALRLLLRASSAEHAASTVKAGARADALVLDVDETGKRLCLGGRPLSMLRRETRGQGSTKRYVTLAGDEGKLLLALSSPDVA